MLKSSFTFLLICVISVISLNAQSRLDRETESNINYPADAGSRVRTYVNPVLPGDHPDPTLLKIGDDFYMCGSSFHFVPNLSILHSRDLLHWDIIARVVPADWGELKSGEPGNGVWQGAISYFYGAYHIYFSNGSGGGQYMSTASNPAGPWSAPVKVKTNAETGNIGYDNSVFIDDDGTPYLVIKPGQTTNRIQQIGRDGNMTGQLINLDWINRNKKYSWAEGPVMCKRNGWYYYLMAGDVNGGQYILRSITLTADSAKWENLGNVFQFSGDAQNRFRSTNHVSAPVQLKDGTWWCLAQSYDAPQGSDWSGQGRQDLLLQVHWTAGGKPYVPYPSDQPLVRPNLKTSGLSWRLPRSDEFNNDKLSLAWHFLNKQQSGMYALHARKDWLRLNPSVVKAHLLQKEAGHSYALLTKVDFDAVATNEQAGIYLCSGNEQVNVKLYSGFDNGRKVIFAMGKQIFSVDNTAGKQLWLKLVRYNHSLTGFFSANGNQWTQVGDAIDAQELDKVQPNFNSWVGTSVGLYAEGKTADFDFFHYKDAFTELPASGCNNYFGIVQVGNAVTTGTPKGGWLMLGGVDLHHGDHRAQKVNLTYAATKNAQVEIWLDDIMGNGKKIATFMVKPGGKAGSWKSRSAKVGSLSGQHDVYLRIIGPPKSVLINTIKFE